MEYIEKLLEIVQKLGSLSAAAIFALIAILQAYFIYRKEKFAEESNEKWRTTREGQIRAEEAQTLVQESSVDAISMLTSAVNALGAKIDTLATIIRERIPRAGDIHA